MVEYMANKSKEMNILFSCIGRRVSLLKSFKKAARALGLEALFIGTDTTQLSSEMQLCAVKCPVKAVTANG